MNNFTEYDYLCHHGVLGMKWGIRRYQNYDGTLIKSGSVVRKKTKYTNIDGSLNERGKLHSQEYINKEIKKNEKYYAKYIKKYEKLAEKYKDDPEMHKKFLDMKKDAIRTRDSVNQSIKGMDIDEIMSNEAEALNKALKVAGLVTGGAAIAAGSGLTVGTIRNGIANASGELKNVVDRVNLKDPVGTIMDITQNTSVGAKAEEALNTAIGYYAGGKSYVTGLYLKQAINMLEQQGVVTDAGKLLGSGVNEAMNQVDQNKVYNLSNTLNSAFNNVLNNASTADYSGVVRNLNSASQQIDSDSISVAINDILNSTQPAANSAYNSIQPRGNVSYAKSNNVVTPDLNNVDNQISVLMNDPNYKDLINRVDKYLGVTQTGPVSMTENNRGYRKGAVVK